ncbi:polysaccharide deacetylase family protein [Motilibacter deserti]|uniref:Polysaccharide deacetylase family protein n=1 Tax=Motilibacter deserti TaxID=2714956 RepID=A0ABX0H2Q8_9ACTN|nr:polysaccharide deacetylase family protein [Motilibacter deserti]NHC15708.1 polysaccharide deacetylase family protein [Motilibacter deserti]
MRKHGVALACTLAVGGLLAAPAPAQAVDESCPSGTVALSFDDGPSYFRPQTLRTLREKLVPATFLDIGMRVAANPHIARFEVREGHTVLNHTYRHDNLGQLSAADVRREILAADQVLREVGALPFRGVRAPFGGSSATSRAVIAELGYVNVGANAGGNDFQPTTPAATIRDAILNSLADGRILLMHDGPIDTPAGTAVQEALPQVIDGVRARGYCFGAVSPAVQVVPARLRPSGQPIPSIVNPVPFRPIVFAGNPPLSPPQPYAVVSGVSVRYFSVDLADVVAAGGVVGSLRRDLEDLVDTAETAQLRGQLEAQRAALQSIRSAVEGAAPSKLSSAGRTQLLTLVDRMLASF